MKNYKSCTLDIKNIIVMKDFNTEREFYENRLSGHRRYFDEYGYHERVIINKIKGKLYLVEGEELIWVLREKGEQFVEAMVYDNLDYKDTIILKLINSIANHLYDPVREANIMKIMNEAGYPTSAIADMTGYSIHTVELKLKLMTLPLEILTKIGRRLFPLSVINAIELVRLNGMPNKQIELARRAAPITGPVASEATVRKWVDNALKIKNY